MVHIGQHNRIDNFSSCIFVVYLNCCSLPAFAVVSHNNNPIELVASMNRHFFPCTLRDNWNLIFITLLVNITFTNLMCSTKLHYIPEKILYTLKVKTPPPRLMPMLESVCWLKNGNKNRNQHTKEVCFVFNGLSLDTKLSDYEIRRKSIGNATKYETKIRAIDEARHHRA